MAVNPIPEGFHTVTPYLLVEGAAELIDFLKRAFGAEETHRTALPDGRVMHAQLKIGDSMVMMGDCRGHCAPQPCSLYLYVPDADALYRRALGAGAVSIAAPADQFYGDRQGGVKDPAGNTWWIATCVEIVPPDEIARRLAKQVNAKRAAKD